MIDTMMTKILDKERLAVLRELALIDSPGEPVFDRLTELASKALRKPISLVSMVGGDYQFFKSEYGLPDVQQTPLSHSFCQHVVTTNQPLIVMDAREHDLVKENLAIPDLNVISYLGMPLNMRNGKTLGSFCVIDHEPHDWNDTEIDIMHHLAEIVTHEIDLRALAHYDEAYQPRLEAAHQTIIELVESLDPDQSQADFLERLTAARDTFDI